MSRAEAANAVHEIANATMGAAFRVVTVQRGLDPRGFAVVASGGAGPMHAARVAERFEISTVIIPPSCGVGSAVGLLGTDLSTDRVQTRVQHESSLDWSRLESIYLSLAGRRSRRSGCRTGRTDDPGEPVRGRASGRSGSRADRGPAGGCAGHRTPWRPFERRSASSTKRTYGIAAIGALELVSYRVRVTKVVPKVPLGRQPAGKACPQDAVGTRSVWFAEFGGYRDDPRARPRLPASGGRRRFRAR